MPALKKTKSEGYWVIQNLKTGGYFSADDGRGLMVHDYDARLTDCTVFTTQEAAYDKATLLHARVSPTGEGINFKVISYDEAFKNYLENVGGKEIDQ